jgi:hypothetical protein
VTIRDAFLNQASNCASLGSPFMARLMSLAADRLKPGTQVTDRIFSWDGDPSANADNAPLRLAGALHALKLQGKALSSVYPPNTPDDDTLWQLVEDAMTAHSGHILDWLDRPPQTNEVRRAAVILPALALLHDAFGLPVELLELGTSGGLNLRCDMFRLNLPNTSLGPADSTVNLSPDWSGAMPASELPNIIRRTGVDLSLLDPDKSDDRLRLLAYLWADQPERLALTRAAIDLARSIPAEISAGDAGEWLERQVSIPAENRLRVVLHTVAWQYFPSKTRAQAEKAMQSANGPIARIAMEYDGGKGAGATLTTWPDGTRREIARADFHGRWVEWKV